MWVRLPNKSKPNSCTKTNSVAMSWHKAPVDNVSLLLLDDFWDYIKCYKCLLNNPKSTALKDIFEICYIDPSETLSKFKHNMCFEPDVGFSSVLNLE